MATKPLIAIVGETASGKSALALELGERYDGEIIAADSRTVYKGMDIGTAKPSTEERAGVPHHLIDVVEPGQAFTVADFKQLANEAIENIHRRGKLPILVGGTGLYADAVLYDFEFRPKAKPAVRERLSKMSVEELQAELTARGIPLPLNNQNHRHLIRALETGGQSATRKPLRDNTLVLGLQIEREILGKRIETRVGQMVRQGFVEEVQKLFGRYPAGIEALKAPGYKAFYKYLQGEVALEEAKKEFVQADISLAKRQRTWFKRNPDIHWISSIDEAVRLTDSFLNNKA